MGSEARARLGLAALVAVALVSFALLFEAGGYVGPALLGALLATIIAIAMRRLRTGTLLTLAVSTAALSCYVLAVFAGQDTFYGLPTPEAASAVARALRRAYEVSRIDFAPVPLRPGYVVLVVVGMWSAATIGEVATFRWRRPLVASLPTVLLVSFVLTVGANDGAAIVVALLLAALLTYWGLESSHRLRSWGRWLRAWEGDTDREPPSIAGAVARRMGAACIAAALVAPVFLPALGEGLLAWRAPTTGDGSGEGGGGPGGRIDPLVSIAPRLIQRTANELFTVETDAVSYWRLTSLAGFDGETWEPEGGSTLAVEGGRIESSDPALRSQRRVTQRFSLTTLSGELLPAAARPVRIELDDDASVADDLVSDPDTGELRLESGDVSSLSYEVESIVPEVSYDRLENARIGDPGPDVYTHVPPEISKVSNPVVELLERWVDERDTPFERLLAIQRRLRRFRYSLSVQPSSSSDHLTRFLTKTRAGFCQQFATAFAVLARMQGFPARVSVGFLPGEPVPGEPGMFVVRGTHAHAWPEVYFEDFGWVRFEPTPRAETAPPSYLGRATGPGGAGGGGDVGPERVPADVRGGRPDPGLRDVRALDQPPVRRPAWARAFDRLTSVALVATLAFLIVVPLVKEYRIRRRYWRGTGSADKAVAAFAHFEDEASELVAPRLRSESAVSYSRRLAVMDKAPAPPALELAGICEQAEYARRGVSSDQAERAKMLALELRNRLWSEATWGRRAVRLFSPKALLGDL